MLDIQDGDILVIDQIEYPIVAVGQWQGALNASPSFNRMATVTASTRRAAPVSGGQRDGSMNTILQSVSVTPFDVLTAAQANEPTIGFPFKTLRCYAADTTGFVELTVEEKKR